MTDLVFIRKFRITYGKLNLIILVLLGCLSIGNAGKFLFGLSIFDLILIMSLFLSVLSQPKVKIIVLVWFIFILSGIFSIFLNKFLFKPGIQYNFIVTELRYFLYFPLIHYVVLSLKPEIRLLKPIVLIITIIYILTYLLLREGTIVYRIFNNNLIEGEDIPLDYIGRVSGPQILFLSILVFLYFVKEKGSVIFVAIAYSILILLVYIKTGSRTGLVMTSFPLFMLLFIRKNLISFLLIPASILVIPLFINATQLNRFYGIFNPSGDSSLLYRLININVMTGQIISHPQSLIVGFGIGSNYNVYLFNNEVVSYFLDSTPFTLIYKIGIPLTIFFYFTLIEMSKGLPKYSRIYLLMVLILPSLVSYHLISHPEYFLGYIFGISILGKKYNDKNLGVDS